MSTGTLKRQISGDKTRVFRRLKIKRREADTGLFETDWQDVSNRVKRWGSISKSLDPAKPNKIVFSNMKITVDNFEGEFNPETDSGSLWFGYASRQRTLCQVEAGFLHQTLGSDGIWTNTELPTTSSVVFTGLISGEMFLSDKNEVNLNVKPLLEVFRQYPAASIELSTSTGGIVASRFFELVRDHTNGSGTHIFRPFFGDTNANFDITTTTTEYPDITTTADNIRDATVLDVMERLSEAEGFVTSVTKDGVLTFGNRTENTSTAQYQFYGRGDYSGEYGHTIKQVKFFGSRINRYYSRVRVTYGATKETDFYLKEADFTIAGNNTTWNLGHRTLEIDNEWIGNISNAQTLGDALFNDLSALKNEIEYTTTFIPHLDLLDLAAISYDSKGPPGDGSKWDLANWGFTNDEQLYWDETTGQAISLQNEEFKFLRIDINLDKLECKFIARET